MEGRHAATINHDILINELMERTVNEHLPGAYSALFRDDGELIVHPDLKTEGAAAGYNILKAGGQAGSSTTQFSSEEQRHHVRRIFEQVKNRAPGQTLLELPEYGEYIAVERLKGPGWNFVMVLPETVVSSAAFRVARYVLVFGLVSLLLELAILFWVLRQQITRPLLAFTLATGKLAAGDFKVELDTSRRDELGHLARAFYLMAEEIQRREEALRQANEELERRVEERTRELADKNHELQQTLVQLREAQQMLVLREKMASLGRLAAGVAHELRNPLNFIINFAELSEDLTQDAAQVLKEWRGNPEPNRMGEVEEILAEIVDYAERIAAHGRRASGVISSMLTHSLASSEKRVATDINQLMNEAVQLSYQSIRARDSSFKMEIVESYDASISPVELVAQEISRVFINMLENACYSTRQKRQSCGENYVPEISVRTINREREIELTIRDNGMGIPKENLDQIFQPFFTTKPPGEGAGLGLSICYDIVVHKHQGDIDVSTQEGEYAEFTIILPKGPVRDEVGQQVA
jgi:signal transduction histidine kinase